MKKMLTMFGAAVLTTSLFAGIGATQEWVQKYVAAAISNSVATVSATAETSVSTNGDIIASLGTAELPIRIVCEPATEAAFRAYDVTAAGVAQGVTNKLMWAWSPSNNYYKSKDAQPIVPTTSNLTYKTYQSVAVDGDTIFRDANSNNLFKVAGILIQPKLAKMVKGE